jgi:hypothetical protein
MTSTSASLTRTFAKPLINGAVSGIALNALFPGKSFHLAGKSVPVGVFGLALGAGSSFLTGLVSNWVLPWTIAKDPKAAKFTSMVLELGSSAAIFVVAPRLMSDGELDTMDNFKLAGTGVVAELASSYVYSNFVAGKGSLLGGAY